METTYNFEGKEYTLTNEGIEVGDNVYPIADGFCQGNEFIFSKYNFSERRSGFPRTPHIIKNLNYSEYKPYQVHTSYGFGPKEMYYKIKSVS